LTTKRLKHSTNFESVENVRSSNVVKFELELRHIPTVPKHACSLVLGLLCLSVRISANKILLLLIVLCIMHVGCLQLLDTLPQSVYRVCDLLTTRNGVTCSYIIHFTGVLTIDVLHSGEPNVGFI